MKQFNNEAIHRLFVALPISPQLQVEILKWERPFKDWPVRWLKGKNLHITLVPPWAEANVEAVAKKLAAVSGARPFNLQFGRVTFGPGPLEPRLIWAQGEAPPEILALKQLIERALSKAPKPRPFQLHLTLARFRPENFADLPAKNLNAPVNWRETVSSFVLMESHLSSLGAEYEILNQFQLK